MQRDSTYSIWAKAIGLTNYMSESRGRRTVVLFDCGTPYQPGMTDDSTTITVLGQNQETDTRVFQWHLTRATNGITSSYIEVAQRLQAGRGVPQDTNAAAKWFLLAAEATKTNATDRRK